MIDWDMIHIKIWKEKNNLYRASFHKDSDFRAGREDGSFTYRDEVTLQISKKKLIKGIKTYLKENL